MAIYQPTFNSTKVADHLGRLLGIDPSLVADAHAESDSEHPNSALVTLTIRKRIPIEQFNEVLNASLISER